NFAAQFAGQSIARRLYLSADLKSVTIFYDQVLPASARVRVTINGDALADALGYAIDVDGDGVLGGTGIIDFDTLTLTTIPGTIVCGRVFASELEPVPGGGSINVPLEGARITVDGSNGAMDAFTDNVGNFCLDPAPAGSFFVHIDGREATNPIPAGSYYPYVGKQWQSVPGQNTNIGDIFLPLVPDDTLQNVSATQPVTITFAPSVLAQHPEFAGTEIVVPANNLFANNGTRGGQVGMAPVPPDRLPSSLPPDLNFPVVITVQTDGADNFDLPVPVCFPNLPDPTSGQPLPAGSKSALWSFNHDTGNWDIVGPMTVSPDGTMVCSDPGSGVLSPGWHGTQPGSSVSGGSRKNECKPSPGGNPLERVACSFNRPSYCELKFGNSCTVSCQEYNSEGTDPSCFAGCVNLCNIWRAQCLAGSECPFEPSDGEGPNASSGTQCSVPTTSADPQTANPGECINDPSMAASSVTSSVAEGLHYYATEDRGSETIIRRGVAGSNGLTLAEPVLLSPNTSYRLHVLQAESLRVGYLNFSTPGNGSRVVLPEIGLGSPTSPDLDNDGLHDYAEYIMGTDVEDPDSDDDGIIDGAEVRQGQNPLDGIPAAIGIVATADTPGTAVDVCALNDIAAVADSEAGVSVFNVFSGMNPTIIAQVDTPGSATAVACAPNRIAVADGAAGLAIIDITDPPAASILHQVNLGGPVNAVATAGNLVYAGLSTGKIAVVDMVTGAVLQEVNTASGVFDLALGDDALFAILMNNQLQSYSLAPMALLDSVDVSSFVPEGLTHRKRLFVGGGHAYVTSYPGYDVIDVRYPAEMQRVGVAQDGGPNSFKQIVLNGSG
ncbi:MAG: hypothetical protein WA029_17700, partial [Anaerolineae bacterium]